VIEFNRIFTGGMELCPPVVPGLAFVHACKTCHRQLCGQPRPADPDYLYREHNGELFLNLIDPDKPLFSLPLFEHALDWMTQRHRNGEDVVIHCDQGNSRSRSLALLLCARLGFVTADSLQLAAFEFANKTGYAFTPGRGITIFMEQNWEALMGRETPRERSQREAIDALVRRFGPRLLAAGE